MPRKKLIYTHEYPYHVYARSNNHEWFYLPKERVLEIFKIELKRLVIKFDVLLHSFVLMDNHYHMLVTTAPKATLGEFMCIFQKSVSRKINSESGRVNHVFGGPYRASLIRSAEYYFQVYKYVYRNPVEAGICGVVEEYPFSTLTMDEFGICSPTSGIAHMIPTDKKLDWLNQCDEFLISNSIKRGLRKTEFKPVFSRLKIRQ